MFLGAARDVRSDKWDSILIGTGPQEAAWGAPVNLKYGTRALLAFPMACSWPFVSSNGTDRAVVSLSMVRKSVTRFSEKIMLDQKRISDVRPAIRPVVVMSRPA